MNEINIINLINKNLINNTSFKLDDRSGQKTVRLENLSLCQYLPNGHVSQDVQIGDYLIEKISDSQISPETRDAALKTALLFQKKHLNSYYQICKPQELSQISKQISEFEAIDKFSKKLNIPFDLLLNDAETLKLIKANYLHYRIDSTYLERGFGPKVQDNQILFPVNLGSSFNDNDVLWLPLSSLPADKKGTIQYNYGPFGFEPYRADQSTEIRPIKLQARPKDIRATIRLELVTDSPNYDPQKLSHGSFFGHSWIRVYEPQMINGKDTGKDFVYSIGYAIEMSPLTKGNNRLITPDLSEFKADLKLTCNQSEISPEKWQELKSFIEKLQLNIKGEMLRDKDAIDTARRIKYGTCCNFSTEIFRRATGKQFDARLPIMKIVRSITQPVGSVMKYIVPEFITFWGSRLQNGYFPGTLMCQQRCLAS